MRRSAKSLSLPAAILVAVCLAVGAAGCAGAGSTVKGAISSAASNLPSRSATAATATTAGQPAITAPAAPSSAAPQSTTTAAPAAGSGTSLLWLWILLGAVLVAVLIAWITRVARRGSATATDRRSRLVEAYAQGSALRDAMSVAETPGAMAAADAGARWADIQRRADDLAQTLYALRESVPDPADQMRVADTLASLQAARSAMDAERAPGGAGPWQAEIVRGRLDAFESSLQALRADDQRYP
ncbi:MAG: hypothetical protein WAV12_10980 [Trebonia sp.]|uniref:hypothetical protein n=2 Tax=Trebonia sp. TaxID=2767075 RepID=UPI003BB19064